jgi:microfibrillar-associated protein 1
VKKFGFRGRTKYTHLLDQDTTRVEKPLHRQTITQSNYLQKRGGIGNIDDDGRVKKRNKEL